jgi:regulator of protease activity HflC (stomatin/prohibitin superfamily)
VATTLDYQFGFKVSETWFYQFMERAIIPLALVWALTLWLLTGILVVAPDEVAFIERFGQPVVRAEDEGELPASVYGPGFYLKLPWPFSVARHVPAYRMHALELGLEVKEDVSPEQRNEIRLARDESFILWGEEHIDARFGSEINLLVPSISLDDEKALQESQEAATGADEGADTDAAAGQDGAEGEPEAAKSPPVNVARVLAHVHYRVRRTPAGDVDSMAVYAYQYGHVDVDAEMERLAHRALNRLSAKQDFIRWVSVQREESVETYEGLLKEEVEEMRRQGLDLGVEVAYVGIPVVHPPTKTAQVFEAVMGAMEQQETALHLGHIERLKRTIGAKAEAAAIVAAAEAQAYGWRMDAKGDLGRFQTILETYTVAKDVYRYRTYLDVLEDNVSGHDIIVVPVAASEVQIIDLTERVDNQLTTFGAMQ